MKKNLYYIALPIFTFFFLSVFTYLYLFSPNYFYNSSLHEFEIKKGETFNSVTEKLFEQRLIRNTSGFKISGFITGKSKKIRAGNFILHSGDNFFEILDVLSKGGNEKQITVSIPEGIWQYKLAELLNSELNIDENKFLDLSENPAFLRSIGVNSETVEGYLLPNTYFFGEKIGAAEVIEKLKYENDKIFKSPRIKNQISKLGFTRHEILTLASIIDGESNKISEFDTISAVYHNRIKKGIALQADPTVQYLKRKRRKYNKIYYKDLEIDSPYNTYKYRGLPPGPINNPGKEAILAAIFPADVDYLYFVADGSGGHFFATKYSEHLKNVRKYRKWRRQNR